MSDFELEERQRRSEAAQKGWLTRSDNEQWERLERETAKQTSPKKEIDYAARTEKYEKELEEWTRNSESRAEAETQPVFNDVERLMYDSGFRKLADYLGLESKDMRQFANELSLIMDWAVINTKKKDVGILDVLKTVKGLKRELGFQEVGPTSVKTLYKYIRLDLDSHRVEDKQVLSEIEQEKELLKV